MPNFLPEIIEYNTIIIESAVEVTPENKLEEGPITQHYNIITTTSDENHKLNKIDDDGDNHEGAVTITKVNIEPTSIATTVTQATMARPKEVVSYQRFGRIDKKTTSYPFKCHLCGFSCRFKESLLSHFKQVHPH